MPVCTRDHPCDLACLRSVTSGSCLQKENCKILRRPGGLALEGRSCPNVTRAAFPYTFLKNFVCAWHDARRHGEFKNKTGEQLAQIPPSTWEAVRTWERIRALACVALSNSLFPRVSVSWDLSSQGPPPRLRIVPLSTSPMPASLRPAASPGSDPLA